MNDYYAILGVSKDAPADEIKRAYRTLARRFHPDRNQAPEAEERFKAIGAAYAVLGDPAQRQHYDAELAGAQDAPYMSMDSGLFDELFRQIFSGAERSPDYESSEQAHGWANGQAATAEIELTLEEAHAGALKTLVFADPHAGRSGSHRVRIPAGARDGEILRIPGVADGVPPLRVRVRLIPHPAYEWQGDQLVRTLPLTPWEASLGAVLPVPTLAGQVMVRIPPGMHAGQRLRIAGKGFAGADLLVRISIDAPTAMTDDQRRAYEALRKSFEECA